jgi:hypothetical protein
LGLQKQKAGRDQLSFQVGSVSMDIERYFEQINAAIVASE